MLTTHQFVIIATRDYLHVIICVEQLSIRFTLLLFLNTVAFCCNFAIAIEIVLLFRFVPKFDYFIFFDWFSLRPWRREMEIPSSAWDLWTQMTYSCRSGMRQLLGLLV